MKRLKKPFLFALATVPISVIGAYFTAQYQIALYSPEVLEAAIAQVGSKTILIAGSMIQTSGLIFICSFFGYILSNKIGLWRPLRLQKEELMHIVPPTILFGILFSLDYWVFGSKLAEIKESYSALLSLNGILCQILYGGILEEIMLRLFVMSLIAFVIWKLFFRKLSKEQLPAGIFVAANLLVAGLFAAGHLPATITLFDTLTWLIVFRCFLLNGAFGIWFGYLYRKYGLSYAMLAHALVHIVSDIVWIIFI
jgi:hypothetical protein